MIIVVHAGIMNMVTLNSQHKTIVIVLIMMVVILLNGCVSQPSPVNSSTSAPSLGIKSCELNFYWHREEIPRDKVQYEDVFPQNAGPICPEALVTFDNPSKAAKWKVKSEWRGPEFSYRWGFDTKHTVRTRDIEIKPGFTTARFLTECPSAPPGERRWIRGTYEVIISISNQEVCRRTFEVR